MGYKELVLDNLSHDELKDLYGIDNENIRTLEELLGSDIVARGNVLMIDEESYAEFEKLVYSLISLLKSDNEIDETLINHTYRNIVNNTDSSWQNTVLINTLSGKPVKFKTYNQYLLSKYVENNDLVFSIGPAGTGKTFLAVALACKALKNGDVKRIILTRPAVEAGESLGFLPGDLKEKIDPYLMPLYDSLYEILSVEQVEKLMEKKIIEVMPLAYMRGRTLNDAYVILDEAQNTTSGQMLMFLTRLGYNSKMIVNGDITQIDLNINRTRSGLVIAREKLKDIKNIAIIEFDKSDIVRNPLVEKIIERFNI